MFKIRKTCDENHRQMHRVWVSDDTVSTPTLPDGEYAASDGEEIMRNAAAKLKSASVQFNVNNLTMSPPAAEKRRVSTATAAACSPRSAIADNTWYPAQLAARPHVAVGIFLPFRRGERLAPTPTRGT